MKRKDQWTKRRASKCVRDSKGRFAYWKGGRTIGQYSTRWRQNNAHGIRTHIGQEFRRQHGRPAVIGDAVRTKRKDGRYHKGAEWYVKTPHGWRNTGKLRKPTPAEIKRICAKARPSRSRKR